MARRNLTQLFTDSWAALMDTVDPGLPYDFDASAIRPTVVLGANPTAAGTLSQALQVDVNGNTRTSGGRLNAAVLGTTFPTTFTGLSVGEWGFIASGTVAGNAAAQIPSSASSDGRLFDIHQILTTLIAVGVATRTMTLEVETAMPAVAGMATTNDFSVAAGPSITDTQQGRIFVPRAPGLVQLNDNGTITTSDISPLPIQCGDGLLIESIITAGLAADSHRVGVLAQRIA